MKIATEDRVVHDPAMGIDRRVFAGQPIPPDLVEAYEAAGGGTSDIVPTPSGRVIAKETVDLRDPNLGITRRVIEGQPVPPDLVAAYSKEVGDSDAAAAAAEEGDTSYSKQRVEDLREEADRRGLEVEGTGADGNVVKDDLVKALEADDAK